MGGMSDDFQVTLTYKGKPVELETPVFWDWCDDNDEQLYLNFYINIPEGF